MNLIKTAHRTATCDKAGSPNDVCPYGQVMSASPNDVAYGYDVVPAAQWANITYTPSENKISYNTLYLASKIVCKRDEKISSLLCFDIKLLYGRFANGVPFLRLPGRLKLTFFLACHEVFHRVLG